jgi:hypothetical protein
MMGGGGPGAAKHSKQSQAYAGCQIINSKQVVDI